MLFGFFVGRDLAGHDVDRRPRVAAAQARRSRALVIPIAATLTAGDHVRASTPSSSPASSRGSRITPRLDWLLVVPLLLELYVFIARRRADPRDAVRAPPRHRPGVGARRCSCSSTPRRSSTRSGSCRRSRATSSSSTRSRRCSRTSARSSSTPTCRRTRSPPPRRSRRSAGSCRSRSPLATLRRRPAALPARRAVVRGARVTPAGDRGLGCLEDLPAAAPARGRRSRSTSCTRSSARRTSGSRRSTTSRFAVEEGEFFGIIGAERQRQEHAAQDPRRDLPAGLGHGARRRRAVAVHRARRRLQPGAHRPRQRPHQRRRCSALASVSSRSASTRSSSSPGSSASSTRS